MKKITIGILLVLMALSLFSQEKEVIHIWPEKVPGETEAKHPAIQTDNTSGNVKRITSITDPVLEIYPVPGKNSKGGIIVCPGGGHNILAIDKEGYEIAEWINSLGYYAYVLQYRVPQKQYGALQDIQRSIRIVRKMAEDWDPDESKIGVIGFSAGGSLCARASTMYTEKTYEKTDNRDDLSCRPDFTMLIYPAYLDKGINRTLTPELKVNGKTPPTFIFQTADDRIGNSALVYAQALRDAKVSVELHFLPEGGHGYGLREGNYAAETWPELAKKWMTKLK